MECTKCGSEMRRLMRESFLQRKVYPLFGYYPWECPICRKPVLYKKRHLRKRRSRQAAVRPVDPNYTKATSKQAPATIPAAKVR